jgi:sulfite reductase beta subunit-like hemoprotein
MSGCPNGCGQHHIAGLGFQGSIRKLGDRVVPQYFVLVGGAVEETGATFGRLAAKIPARRIPQAVERLLQVYKEEGAPHESATAFFKRLDLTRAKAVLGDLERLTPDDVLPEDFIDLGEDREFKPEVQDGECSA